MILDILFITVVFILMVLCHELGHMLYYLIKTKRNINLIISFKTLKVGHSWQYNLLSSKELKNMLICGLLCGLIPYVLLMNYNWYINLIPYLLYFYGCLPDIKEIISLRSKNLIQGKLYE